MSGNRAIYSGRRASEDGAMPDTDIDLNSPDKTVVDINDELFEAIRDPLANYLKWKAASGDESTSRAGAKGKTSLGLVEHLDSVNSLSAELATTVTRLDIDVLGGKAASSGSGIKPSTTAAAGDGELPMKDGHGEEHGNLLWGIGSRFEDVEP